MKLPQELFTERRPGLHANHTHTHTHAEKERDGGREGERETETHGPSFMFCQECSCVCCIDNEGVSVTCVRIDME